MNKHTSSKNKKQHKVVVKSKKKIVVKLKTSNNSKSTKAKSNKIDFNELKREIDASLKNDKSDSNNRKDRVHTGIFGLDEVMQGGLKRNSVNIVGGGAGSGKSILCMQYLVEGINNYNENGVYISFEENSDKILSNFNQFGWDLENKIKSKKLIILYYTPEQVEKVLESGGGLVRDAIESINAKRLIMDSLTAFTLLQDTEIDKRKSVLKLFQEARKWGVTSLMTSEQEPDPDKHISNVIEFQTDGVILLYNTRKGDVRQRSLEIFKMRATQHAVKIFPMKIEEKGIVIYPDELVF